MVRYNNFHQFSTIWTFLSFHFPFNSSRQCKFNYCGLATIAGLWSGWENGDSGRGKVTVIVRLALEYWMPVTNLCKPWCLNEVCVGGPKSDIFDLCVGFQENGNCYRKRGSSVPDFGPVRLRTVVLIWIIMELFQMLLSGSQSKRSYLSIFYGIRASDYQKLPRWYYCLHQVVEDINIIQLNHSPEIRLNLVWDEVWEPVFYE